MKKYLTLLLTFALVLSVAAGLTVWTPVTATAESASGATVSGQYLDFDKQIPRDENDGVTTSGDTVTAFEIAGVQIRTEAPTGIRFVARISDEVVVKLKLLTGEDVSYGILLQQKSMLDGDLVYEASAVKTRLSQGLLDVPGTATYQFCNGYLYYTAVVWNMPASAYNTEIVARAYLKCGDTYYYATETRPAAGYATPNAAAIGGGFSASLLAVAAHLSETNSVVAEKYAAALNPLNNYVIAGDQKENRVVAYDLLKLSAETDDLETAKVWEFTVNKNTVSDVNGNAFQSPNVDDAKFRYNTVAGDVVLYAGNNAIGVVNYKTKESLYYNNIRKTFSADPDAVYYRDLTVPGSGTNVHSIEILPNGTLVVGETPYYFTLDDQTITKPGMVLFFRWNGETWDGYPFHTEVVEGGHTVLFDGNYLWATDAKELHRYDLDVYNVASGEEFNAENYDAAADHKFSAKIGGGNHCMVVDYTDTNYLLIAGGKYVYRVNKQSDDPAKWTYVKLSERDSQVKGIGVTRTGTYFFTQEEGLTATASYTDENGKEQVGSNRVRSSYQTRRIGKATLADLSDAVLYESEATPSWFYKCQTMDGFYN